MRSKNKILKILILVFLIVLSKQEGTESTVTKEDLDEVCKDAKNSTVENKDNMTIPEFIKYLDIPTDGHDFVTNILLEDEIPSSWDDVPSAVYPFLGLIAFIPLAIITWVLLWCCCICKCGIFKKKDISRTKKVIVFSICVGLFAGVIIAAIIGFSKSNPFVDNLSTFTCSFGKFFYHSEFGEEKTVPPRWIGLSNVITMVADSLSQIGTIISGKTEVFSGLDDVIAQKEYYSEQLESLAVFSTKNLTDDTGLNIKPAYSEMFEYDNDLGNITTEYFTYIEAPLEAIKAFSEQADSVTSSNTSLSNSLTDVKGQVSSLKDAINDIGHRTFTTIKDYKQKGHDLFLLFFLILFGMYVAFAALILVLLFLYSCTKCGFFKIILHVVWNVLIVFIISPV